MSLEPIAITIDIDAVKVAILNHNSEFNTRLYVLDDMIMPTWIYGGQPVVARQFTFLPDDSPAYIAKFLAESFAAVAFYQSTATEEGHLVLRLGTLQSL